MVVVGVVVGGVFVVVVVVVGGGDVGVFHVVEDTTELALYLKWPPHWKAVQHAVPCPCKAGLKGDRGRSPPPAGYVMRRREHKKHETAAA